MGKTVLVVDDSPVDLRLASGLLRNLPDIDVESVASGREALESMQRDTPDLALIDILMPGMSGVELVEEIRGQFPQVATVLMTSRGSRRKPAANSIATKRNTVKTMLSVNFARSAKAFLRPDVLTACQSGTRHGFDDLVVTCLSSISTA